MSSSLSTGSPEGDRIFLNHTDIGSVGQAGLLAANDRADQYQVSGSGANMWGTADAFHFIWKQVSGDIALEADIDFAPGEPGANPHRKAGLILRQTLAPDSIYASAALHGDGLTSLQFREVTGGLTREVQADVTAPRRLRIEKIGDQIHLSTSEDGGPTTPSGASVKLRLSDPFYIGLAVCSHDNDRLETALFERVRIGSPDARVLRIRSIIETMKVASGDRRAIHHTEDLIEAPNWTRDGSALIFNGSGRLFRLPLNPGARPELIDTGFAINCNNDHGISPDGRQIVISDQTENGRSIIYTLPLTGGAPKRITERYPSYWHGWSPDGQTLAYCGERNGDFDIYTIPVDGGEETRLTMAEGLSDGPDYSPDGEWIYFNSTRTGLMQIWRMHPDGSNQEQVTFDDFNNWFAHPSPDGRWIVFLTYDEEVQGHPRDKDIRLRLMLANGGDIRLLASFFGGQGTINVPSWSPDSHAIAYVRYQPVTGG